MNFYAKVIYRAHNYMIKKKETITVITSTLHKALVFKSSALTKAAIESSFKFADS